MTEDEMKAMLKQAWDVPLTPSEAEAAKRGWAGEWQTMTFPELDRLIAEEEKARERSQ
jgi:hypothetical protein